MVETKSEESLKKMEIPAEKVLSKTLVVKMNKQKDKIWGNFTPQSTWEWVPVDKLLVDKYQRDIDWPFVSKIAHTWNQAEAKALTVNLRTNGYYYVIDGQKRHAALQMMENTPEFVWAEVFRDLTPRQEAYLFKAQTNRRNLTSGAVFNAAVFEGDKSALEIAESARSVGLTVDYAKKGPKINNLRAFKTLMDVHRRQGKNGLTRILNVVAKAWPNSEYKGAAPIITGLELFFSKHPTANDKHLIAAIGLTEPHLIANAAHSINVATFSSTIAPAVVIVIRNIYNKGMRKNRLSEA